MWESSISKDPIQQHDSENHETLRQPHVSLLPATLLQLSELRPRLQLLHTENTEKHILQIEETLTQDLSQNKLQTECIHSASQKTEASCTVFLW